LLAFPLKMLRRQTEDKGGFDVVDIFRLRNDPSTDHELVEPWAKPEIYEQGRKKSPPSQMRRRLWLLVRRPDAAMLLVLMTLGIAATAVAAAIGATARGLAVGRAQLVDLATGADRTQMDLGATSVATTAIGGVVWVVWGIVMALLSSAIVWAGGRSAGGSGVPELQSALQGIYLPDFFNPITFACKAVATALALGSGLSVGKEGPFISLAAILAHSLAESRWTRPLGHRRSGARLQILSAAAAAGVGATFGAPLGGLLFAMEISSTYALVRTIPAALFCALCGSVTAMLLNALWAPFSDSITLFRGISLEYSVESAGFQIGEVLAFASLGAACGLIGAFYVRFVALLVRWTRTLALRLSAGAISSSARRDFALTMAAVALVTGIVNTISFVLGGSTRDSAHVVTNSFLANSALRGFDLGTGRVESDLSLFAAWKLT
jgi:H+/Cl- antiporter ClcA